MVMECCLIATYALGGNRIASFKMSGIGFPSIILLPPFSGSRYFFICIRHKDFYYFLFIFRGRDDSSFGMRQIDFNMHATL